MAELSATGLPYSQDGLSLQGISGELELFFPGFEFLELHRRLQLPQAERDRWFPKLELIDMPLGQVMYEGGVTLKYVYFPTTLIISLLYVMKDGAAGEILSTYPRQWIILQLIE